MAFSRKLFPFSPLLPVLHLLSVLRGLFLKRISCKQVSLLKWPLEKWRCNVSFAALHYSAWTFESVFLKLRYIGVCKHLLNFKVNFTISPICWGHLPVSKVQYLDSVSSSHRERNWKQEPQFAQCTISLLNFRLFPTACVECVECVECEEQMLPLYLSLLMASVTPRDGQINFTNVTPLFSAAIKPSADLTFDAAVMGTGTWWT